jgi:hypothetical protein
MKPEDKAVIQQVLDVLVDCIPSDPQEAEKAIAALRQLLEQPADHSEQHLDMVRPQNCGTGYCSCIECHFKKGTP